MEIVSAQFLGFVAVVWLVYYLLPQRFRNLFLLGASYVFLFTWGWLSTLALLGVTLVTLVIVRWLSAPPATSNLRVWFWLGVGLNLALLATYRLLDSAYGPALLARVHIELPQPQGGVAQLVVLIGFAFYILQAISLLVDAYERRLRPDSGFISFALYLAYFPKLLSGPIERPQALVIQFDRPKSLAQIKFTDSLALILIGMVRKIAVADVLNSMLPNYLWKSIGVHYNTLDLWLELIAYAFILYNDFAGYSSIVRGVSLLFGLQLTPNFRQPFFAASFGEFWNRWHMSLSVWLRDTIYFPVSRWLRRKNPNNTHWSNILIPPLVTMLLSGLWHGFSASMLIWGGLHGLYQAIERIIFLRWPTLKPPEGVSWRRIPATLIVFILTTLAWVPFSLNILRGPGGALEMWQALLWQPRGALSQAWLFVCLLPIGLSLLWDFVQYLNNDELVFLKWPKAVQSFLLSSTVLLLVLLAIVNTNHTFIYQGF